jgi:hypothetical protein
MARRVPCLSSSGRSAMALSSLVLMHLIHRPDLEPEWDSSSESLSNADSDKDSPPISTASSVSVSPSASKMKLEGQTYILTPDKDPRLFAARRRQSGHRREFRNVRFPIFNLRIVDLQTSIFDIRSLKSCFRGISFHRLLHSLLAQPRDLHN